MFSSKISDSHRFFVSDRIRKIGRNPTAHLRLGSVRRVLVDATIDDGARVWPGLFRNRCSRFGIGATTEDREYDVAAVSVGDVIQSQPVSVLGVLLSRRASGSLT